MPFDDHMDAWRDAQRAATGLARRLREAVPAAPVTGADETATVEATIDADGRLTGLHLHRGWRTEVGESHLGAAVVAAMNDAAQRRVAAWAAAMNTESTPSSDSPAPDPAAGFALGDPASRQSLHAIRDLVELLAQVESELPARAGRAAAAATRTSTAESLNRAARASVQNGTVTSIDVDQGWARRASEAHLTDAIVEAVAAARRLSANDRAEAAGDSPALTRLRRLTESPETLLREIGLIE